MDEKYTIKDACKIDAEGLRQYRLKLPQIAEKIIDTCDDGTCYTHIDYDPIPSKSKVIEIIEQLREIMFPGYFTKDKLDPINLKYRMGQIVATLFESIAEQITRSIRHDCLRYNLECSECTDKGQLTALEFLDRLPDIRNLLATDVDATIKGDPAAKSNDEIIFSYPGIYAIMVYRLAHALFNLDVPLLPRIMTEYAHSITGIDIHPGARIGKRFVIDHGTGIVIGETTEIGDNVRIYQGVTLGALSVAADKIEELKYKKRHPTIEDDVIIYSGATILGGDTVIGHGSVVGGNVWLTESIPSHTTVLMEAPKLIFKNSDSYHL